MSTQITVKCVNGDTNLFLATPSYDGKVSQSYAVSLASSMAVLAEQGFGVTYSILGGDCHVDDARNALVREFMLSNCDALIFLDADIGWRSDDLLALALHKEDVVAGVYPKKWVADEEYPVTPIDGQDLQANKDGLVEVAGVPTGFLKISRKAMEKMHEVYGQRKHLGQHCKADDFPYTIIFERLYEDGTRLSGDYAFCKRWRQAGGKIFVDPEMQFTHEGTHVWGGKLGEFWRRKYGVTELEDRRNAEKGFEALKAGTATLEHLNHIFKTWGNIYAAAPDLLLACMLIAKEATGPILECGSGLSTLVMALSTKQTVHVLEHSPVWAQWMENKLNELGITNVVIHCEPMTDYGPYEWYTYPKDLPNFSMVLVDGPPRQVNNVFLKGGRAGIIELKEKVRGAQFIFDDADNGHREALDKVASELGFEVEIIEGLRDFAVSKVVTHA